MKRKDRAICRNSRYFLEVDVNNICLVEVTGKECNLGDSEGLQVLCTLHFQGIGLPCKLFNVLCWPKAHMSSNYRH